MSNPRRRRSARNLNALPILGRDGSWGDVWEEIQSDNGAEAGPIRCYFKNIENALTNLIRTEPAEVLVGYIAWCTSDAVIGALRAKAGVSLILDKSLVAEPTLFEGMTGLSAGTCAAIYPEADPENFDPVEYGMEPVRYVGFASSSGKIRPHMHNKFLVFCRIAGDKLSPYAVWTGSANFTHNARHSFENAVFIQDPNIAIAYFEEWMQIVKFSERGDLLAPEPNSSFRTDCSGMTWPVQSRTKSYLGEVVYRTDNLVDRFLLALIHDDIPPDVHDALCAECKPIMARVRRLADALSADLDVRFVPDEEREGRLNEIIRLLKSFSDVDLVAEVEECLAGVENDLEEWGE